MCFGFLFFRFDFVFGILILHVNKKNLIQLRVAAS
jgi:hypothetical protein